jgi:hypothetical protein
MKIAPKKPATDEVLLEQMKALVKPRAVVLFDKFLQLATDYAKDGDFTELVARMLNKPELKGQPFLCKTKMLMAMNTMVTSGIDDFIEVGPGRFMGDWPGENAAFWKG